jgi:Aspartyl protease
MTFRYLIIWILLCINLAVDGQPLGFSMPEGKSRVDIPIEIYNNLPVVSVILNEQLPLKFIIDTGVRTAILTDKSYSDILQIKYTKKYSLTAPGGEKLFDAYVASNVRIDLPGAHREGCALFVLEKDYLELSNHLGITVHGILGYELFSRFVVKIDYERKIMTLIKLEHFKPKKNFVSLPITIEDTKPYLLAPVQLSNGSELSAKLLIDTGASHGLLLDPQSDKAFGCFEYLFIISCAFGSKGILPTRQTVGYVVCRFLLTSWAVHRNQ